MPSFPASVLSLIFNIDDNQYIINGTCSINVQNTCDFLRPFYIEEQPLSII